MVVNPCEFVSAVPHFLCLTLWLVTGKVSKCARLARGSQESECCVCVCVSCPPSAHTHTYTHMPRSQHSSAHWKVTHLTVFPEELTPSALRWSSSASCGKDNKPTGRGCITHYSAKQLLFILNKNSFLNSAFSFWDKWHAAVLFFTFLCCSWVKKTFAWLANNTQFLFY